MLRQHKFLYNSKNYAPTKIYLLMFCTTATSFVKKFHYEGEEILSRIFMWFLYNMQILIVSTNPFTLFSYAYV